MNLNGLEYYYTRNAQGDITGLIDGAKNQVVSYTYDTWGKLVSTTGSLAGTLGVKNPYRYRGYRYDNETGLYYLQSRYYNPDWGRFVNADAAMDSEHELLGHNLFIYSHNNPINLSDPSGETPIQAVFAAIGAIAGWSLGSYVAKRLGYSSGWKYWAIRSGAIVGGAVLGWFSGAYLANIAKSFLIANPAILSRMPIFVLRFLGLAGPSGLLYDHIARAITNVIPNKVVHILGSHHKWGLVNANSWNSVSRLIDFTLRNGTPAAYKAGTQLYSAFYNGQTIQVQTRIANGILQIVDAWVKTR